MTFGLAFALIFVAAVGGAVILAVTAPRREAAAVRREQDDELEFARLRLLAEGVDVHTVPDWDFRTADLVIDPTLRASDVVEMVEHVAPGAGSVASLGHIADDTRIRSVAQVTELHRAEAAAYAEDAVRADADFFARFDRVMSVALAGFQERTSRVDAWLFYQHDDTRSECPHCTEALREVSDEYAQLVADRANTDTGEISKAELRALLARH